MKIGRRRSVCFTDTGSATCHLIVAIFYPFSQFCEMDISLLSLQTQPNTAPNLFQRGVEYGEYDLARAALQFSWLSSLSLLCYV